MARGLVVLLCIASCVGQSDADCGEIGDEDTDVLGVELLQRSISIETAHGGSQDIPESTPQGSELETAAIDRRDVEEQLKKELITAREARQHLDSRIAALESRLRRMAAAAPEESTDVLALISIPVDDPERYEPELYFTTLRNRKMCVLVVIFMLIAFQMILRITTYIGRQDEEDDPPWYHDNHTMMATAISASLLWFVLGLVFFTQFLVFTKEQRHLTIVEAVYLTAQVTTTIGYGELTPWTNAGKCFMIFYCVTGVVMIGSLLQELAYSYLDSLASQRKNPSSSVFRRFSRRHVDGLLVVLCLAIGTAFFSWLPGEQKTVLEAFYFSVVSLLTIGFGAYHPVTQVGKLFGSFWMIIGVVCVGRAMLTLTDDLFHHRAQMKSRISVKKMVSELTDSSPRIDEATLLKFDLVRSGVSESLVKDSHATVNKYLAKDIGIPRQVSVEEFENYIQKETAHTPPRHARRSTD